MSTKLQIKKQKEIYLFLLFKKDNKNLSYLFYIIGFHRRIWQYSYEKGEKK